MQVKPLSGEACMPSGCSPHGSSMRLAHKSVLVFLESKHRELCGGDREVHVEMRFRDCHVQ